jgi:hypothetical protein
MNYGVKVKSDILVYMPQIYETYLNSPNFSPTTASPQRLSKRAAAMP